MITTLRLCLAVLLLAVLPAQAQGVTERSATVNGVRISYKTAGSGPVVVVKGSGHWLMEEAPQQVIPGIVQFLKE